MPADRRVLYRGQSATHLTVASSTTTQEQKNSANFICDGTADDVELQAALDALSSTGGKIALTDGTFNLSAQVTRAIDNVTVEGAGGGTIVNLDGSTPCFSSNGRLGWQVVNISCDGGGSIPSAVLNGPTFMLADPVGASVAHNVFNATQSNMALFPATADNGTATATNATTLTDSGKSWITNQYANFYVVAIGSATAYGTIASNTGTVITLSVAGWVDSAGSSTTTPDATSTYVIVPNVAFVTTITGGVGAQMLYLTLNPTIPSTFVVTITFLVGDGNILNSAGVDTDITLTWGQSLLLVRSPGTGKWVKPL